MLKKTALFLHDGFPYRTGQGSDLGPIKCRYGQSVIYRTNLYGQLSTHTRHIFFTQKTLRSWAKRLGMIMVVGRGGNNYLRPKLVAGLRFCVLVRMWKRKRECEQRLNNCPPTSPIPTTTTTITPPPPTQRRPT